MGEHSILSAWNGFIHQGRRKDRHGADFHGHHLGEQQIIVHGVQGVSLTAGFTYAKASAAGDLTGNLGHEVKKTAPQLGNLVVSQGGAVPQAGGEYMGNLHNPGADRQGLCQVGQQVLVRFWFLAYDDIQPVFALAGRTCVVDGLEGSAEGFAGFKTMVQRNVDDASLRVDELPGRMGQTPFLYIAADALSEDGGELPV